MRCARCTSPSPSRRSPRRCSRTARGKRESPTEASRTAGASGSMSTRTGRACSRASGRRALDSTTTSSGHSTSRCSSSSAAASPSRTRSGRFRSFFKDGFDGHKATLDDWKTHLNTLFPEVRLKRTLEIRAADAQSADLACALPALYTGIFYDDRALAEAEAFVDGWTIRGGRRPAASRLAGRAASDLS